MAENAKKKKGSLLGLEKNIYGYLFTAPFIIGFLLFSLYPLVYTFYLSITDMTLMSKTHKIVGFLNFSRLFDDKFFMQALGNTWKLWMLNFVPQLGIAMLLAVWFTNKRYNLKYVGVFRALYYLPNILMPATVAVLFASLFNLYGPVNQFLVRSGIIEKAIDFGRSEATQQSLVIFINWWMWFGSTIVVIMAGMTSISPSFYESAMVDGATSFQMFTKITLPQLKPVLVYTLVTSLVGGMQMFDIPYLLTDGRGGPNGSIVTMNILMYLKYSSGKGFIGAAAAVGVMIFIITCVCSVVIMKALKDRDPAARDAKPRKVRRGGMPV